MIDGATKAKEIARFTDDYLVAIMIHIEVSWAALNVGTRGTWALEYGLIEEELAKRAHWDDS